MSKRKGFCYLLFLLVLSLPACIDLYDINNSQQENLLVVDAKLTNENISHIVKLTRSKANLDELVIEERNALVIISGVNGEREVLKEVEPGIYKTDSTKFTAEIGGKYRLSITTSNGKNYESEECEILPPTNINNISYKADKIIDSNNEEVEGVRFYIDGASIDNKYLRWTFEEDWKFKVPFPTYVGFDENKKIQSVPVKNQFCWKNSSSYEIAVQSLDNQSSIDILGKDICFIPSSYTDRFQIKYSILIKQLSISKTEYEFWTRMKKVNDESGDIFGLQPFSIQGNIKCTDDDNEVVLGYFQTGGVSLMRTFISSKELRQLGLKLRYYNSCSYDTVMVDNNKLRTLYDLYEKYVLNDGWGLYDQHRDNSGKPLDGLWITRPVCSDCSLSGTAKKPLFWED